MPFVPNMDDEEEKTNGQGPVAPAGGGAVHLAPGSGIGSAGPGGSAAAPQAAGGSFASLDKYLAANQGQAEPLAGKITGAIGEEYKGLDQANQGVLQGIQDQVKSAPGYTAGDAGLLSKEAENPVSFANDQNNVSAFQKQLTNSYGGPNSAEGTNDYQSQQAKLNDAIAQGNVKTQTDAGRTQLIGENTRKANTGTVALNSAILSQDPNYLGQVESAYKPFSNLVSGLNTGAQDINKTIASEQSDAASSSKAAKDAITGQITGLNSSVQGALTAAQQKAASANAALKADLAAGTPTAQDLQALGMSSDQWNSLSAADKAAATSQVVSSSQGQFQAQSGTATIDPTQWLTQQDPNAVFNAGNIATADDYAKAGAFQNLLKGLNLETPTLAINPANAAQAGTAPANLNTYDYQTALQTAQDTQSAERVAAQAYVDALQSGADEEHAQLAAQNAHKNSTMTAVAGVAQTPIAATTAVASGLYGAGQKLAKQAQNAISSPKNAAINIAENIGTGGLFSGVPAVVAGVSKAVNTVTNIFCFHPLTLVEMADGDVLPIEVVEVGDETRGGKVLATLRGVGTDFYWYNGVLVTGKHAVKEDGRWVRVENAKQGKKVPSLTEVVCTLVTSNHRIWAGNTEFADNYETDAYESLDLDESLAALNSEQVR